MNSIIMKYHNKRKSQVGNMREITSLQESIDHFISKEYV